MSTSERRVFPAVHALIEYGNKFLVIKQVVMGEHIFWDLPGGKVEFGESPKEALHREVREEVGLTIDILEPVGMWQFVRLKDGNQVVSTVFRCRAHHDNVRTDQNPSKENIPTTRWLTASEYCQELPTASDESLQQLLLARFKVGSSVKGS